MPDSHGTRLQKVQSPAGRLVASYDASIMGEAAATVANPTDLIIYLRPSRYAESDTLGPTAFAEFGGITDPAELLASVSSWVGHPPVLRQRVEPADRRRDAHAAGAAGRVP